MKLLDALIASVFPQQGLRRAQARATLRKITAHYDAASVSPRTGHRRAPGTDADAAAAQRHRMANVARDMIRNTPFAARAQQVIANNVVGDGIIPKVRVPPGLSIARATKLQETVLRLIERDLDTVSIDADGRQNLYGLQRLAMNAIVDAGEVLILRTSSQGERLQVRLLEADYLDDTRVGALTSGGWIHEGIEYNSDGVRVAYWLFDQHPGAMIWGRLGAPVSRRYPAENVLHVYRQDRAGQMRGVSWFSSIAIPLQDLGEFQDAQLVRQKIAACFVAFRQIETRGPDARGQRDPRGAEMDALSPGLIQDIGMDENVTFGTPPDSGDFDPFTRAILRSAAAGLGLTYEAMTGDLSNVNFSSARMGRIEMDRNVSSWQWTMLIPQMLQPMAEWIMYGWQRDLGTAGLLSHWRDMIDGQSAFEWVPPYKVLVDPTREIPSLIEGIKGGLFSLSDVVRSLGRDPERHFETVAADNATLDRLQLQFSSDFRVAKPSAVPADSAAQPDDETKNRTDDEVSARHITAQRPFTGV